MKVLEVRPHSNAKKASDGYVQVHVDGRWRSNREFHLGCNRWTTGQGYTCSNHIDPNPDLIEFVQLESLEDCDLVEAAGAYWVHIASGDVFRRCKVCGEVYQTFHGYRPKGSSIPLATGNHRWATKA